MSYISRGVIYQALSDVTVANTTTEMSGLAPTMNGSNIINPDLFHDGFEVNVQARGLYQLPTLINAADLTVKVMLGATSRTLPITANVFNTLSLLGGASARPFGMDMTFTHRPGSLVTLTGYLAFVDGSGTFRYQTIDDGTDVAFDRTQPATVDARLKWSSVPAIGTASMRVRQAKISIGG